jgi:polysaccharide export outer membrane protein
MTMAMKTVFPNDLAVLRRADPFDYPIAVLALLLFGFCTTGRAQQTLPTMSSQQQGAGGSSSGAGSKVAAVLANMANGKNSSTSASVSTPPPGGLTSVGALTDAPIFPGETVHLTVFNAPDFSIVSQVSDGGDIAVPMAGPMHIAGMNSKEAGQAIADELKTMNLLRDPRVAVTVDTQAMGITVLGEVHTPGIYPPTGKQMLSDLIAMAGGMTGNTGRVVEVSNVSTPEKKSELSWDPTLHNTANSDILLHPGDRVIVRPCGIAYVGGNVGRPGAYSLCSSQTTTLSELVDLAGGVNRFNNNSHTYIIRTRGDGSRVVMQINIDHILKAKAADVTIQEDDIVYVTSSALKLVAVQAVSWAVSVGGPLIYSFH